MSLLLESSVIPAAAALAEDIFPRSIYEPRVRINSVCPYYTMFPIDFPLGVLRDAPSTARVLDPFCGRGTTLYAARMLGLPAVGIDINHVAVAVAQAKLAQSSPEAVLARAEKMIAEFAGPVKRPWGKFWRLAYHAATLQDLLAIREGLLTSRNDDTTRLLRAAMLGILHGPRNLRQPSYLSNQMPRTYATKPAAAVRFWEKRGMRPEKVNVLDVLERRVRYLLEGPPAPAGGKVILGDARKVLRPQAGPFTHIITSPPYVGMKTYLPDQWLRSWFLGGPAEPVYKLPGSIGSAETVTFVQELSEIWSAVARASVTGAELHVRFGGLPSVKRDVVKVLADSLSEADGDWELIDCVSTPAPRRHKRQAAHFVQDLPEAHHEIDAHYRLRG